MTPERNNDNSLFTNHPTIIPFNKSGKTLHVLFHYSWGNVWMEHVSEFSFTSRIKYKIVAGDCTDVFFEITWLEPRAKLFGIWKRTGVKCMGWKSVADFDDKYPHKVPREDVIVDC